MLHAHGWCASHWRAGRSCGAPLCAITLTPSWRVTSSCRSRPRSGLSTSSWCWTSAHDGSSLECNRPSDGGVDSAAIPDSDGRRRPSANSSIGDSREEIPLCRRHTIAHLGGSVGRVRFPWRDGRFDSSRSRPAMASPFTIGASSNPVRGTTSSGFSSSRSLSSSLWDKCRAHIVHHLVSTRAAGRKVSLIGRAR